MPTFLSLPEKASSMAGAVNLLLLAMLAVGFIFVVWIALFAIESLLGGDEKEEKESASDKDRTVPKWWSIVVGLVVIVFFLWSSFVYLNSIKVPDNAKDIISVTKHWVWKFQHTPDGKGEIDELHVVVGEPVRLIMTSQDTTHSLFIPNFMQQQDILPGKFTAMWFAATRPGEYPFYTTQYSGTGYTKMAGKIIAMEQADYDAWLSGKALAKPGEGGEVPAGGLVAEGESLFMSSDLGCSGCHTDQDTPTAPTLHDIYGKEIELGDGSTVTVDDDYLHEAIINPGAKVVKGYNDIMPKNYGDDLSNDQIQALIAYIKSLSGVMEEGGEAGSGEAGGAGGAMQLSPEAMAVYTDNGCSACHGQNLEGMIGPNLAGLSTDYIEKTVRSGVDGTAMTAYDASKISDNDLATLANGIENLSFAATGMQVNPTVAGHLQDAATAFDSGDMDGARAALEAALKACGQPGGQVTLKTMIRKSEEGDTDYLKMRFDILLGGKNGESTAEAPAADATQAPEPTKASSSGGISVPAVQGDATAGEATFTSLGCNSCHTDQDTPVAPTLHGVYGSEVQLENKPPVTADDAYIIESILDPGVNLVKGYGPLMPATYSSLNEQDLADLLAYIKSLAK
jgi:cytochrome c oxidase subunit 2